GGERCCGLSVDGRVATAAGVPSGFPAGRIAVDAELAVLAGAEMLAAGSLHETEQCLMRATRMSPSVPTDRRGRFEIAFALVRLALCRARNDVDAVAEESHRLVALVDA